MRVLIVEDSPVQLDAFSRYLKRHGHEVDTAATRSLAVEMITQHSYDAAAVDWVLPASSGLEVALAACRKGIPVVLMSGAPMEDILGMQELVEVAGYEVTVVKKPMTDEGELLNALNEAIAAKRAHAEVAS